MKIVALICMELDLNIEEILSLEKEDEIYMIGNAGGLATEDAIHSLRLLYSRSGIDEIIIINHTECILQKCTDEYLKQRMEQKYNTNTSNFKIFSFKDVEKNLEEQIEKLKSSNAIPNDIPILGLIFDTKTRTLKEIVYGDYLK